MKGSKMQYKKSAECLAIEELMDNSSETQLVLEYGSRQELFKRYPVVYNIIVRNAYPLEMKCEGNTMRVTKINKEER